MALDSRITLHFFIVDQDYSYISLNTGDLIYYKDKNTDISLDLGKKILALIN